MTSGRYTAYHIYEDLSFPEAQKAGTWPYKLPVYQCKHSQRGALFQFANMVERTHFDAAVTSCCNEPVLNFANKPQYSEASRPMNPQDCGAKVESQGCAILEVHVESVNALCASKGAKVSRIKIQCPSLCPDLVAIQGGGKLKGAHGEFRSLGMEAGDIMILDYTPNPETVSGYYTSCQGRGTLVEDFCGGHTLSFSVRAGLDFPGGCGCDCCGESGVFPPPVMSLDTPAQAPSTWQNTEQIGDAINGSQACSGGDIAGTFTGVGGSTSVQWDGPAEYQSDGLTRFIARIAPSIGSSGNPACCGGLIYWSGSDGCGDGAESITDVPPRIGASQLIPPPGQTLYENQIARFSGSGACSYASSADLDISSTCLTNSPGQLRRFDGYLRRDMGDSLRYSGVHECSGCCGSGSITVSFADGCGGVMSGEYSVRRPYSDSNPAGRAHWCAQTFGNYYQVRHADVYCSGGSGLSQSGLVYGTLGQCLAAISGAGATYTGGLYGCYGGQYTTQTCCLYTDNGQSGEDFMSWIHHVSGNRCCVITGENQSWIRNGGDCCSI